MPRMKRAGALLLAAAIARQEGRMTDVDFQSYRHNICAQVRGPHHESVRSPDFLSPQSAHSENSVRSIAQSQSEGGFPGRDIVNRPIPELQPDHDLLSPHIEGLQEGVGGLLLVAAFELEDGKMMDEMFNSLCATICSEVKLQGNA